METPTTILPQFLTGDVPAANHVSDAFASIEKHNLRVAEIFLHPSIFHRFSLDLGDIFEVSPEEGGLKLGLVGSLWGAEVSLDPDAPPNGFEIKSDDGTLSARFVGSDIPQTEMTGVPTVFCKSPVLARSIMTLLDMGRPFGSAPGLRLEMTPLIYADVQKFGRDIIDIETRASELRKGIQGTILGVTLVVPRTPHTAHPTRITLRDDNKVYGLLETDPNANPALKELTDRVLGGDISEVLLDKVTAGIKKGFDEVWRDIAYSFDTREDAAKDEIFRSVVLRLVTRTHVPS